MPRNAMTPVSPDTALATTSARQDITLPAELTEKVVVGGDLSGLTPEERLTYYNAVCRSLGLNPLTKPFEYIVLDNRLTLYIRRDGTDQLRRINNISVKIVGRDKIGDVYIVTAKAWTQDGREDESTGAVPLTKEGGDWHTSPSGKRFFKPNGTSIPLSGDALANALMRAESKAKRRVTLSLVGLGWLDESELDTLPAARRLPDHDTRYVPVAGAAALGTADSAPADDLITDAEAQRLAADLATAEVKVGKFLEFFNVTELDELTVSQAARARQMLEKRRTKRPPAAHGPQGTAEQRADAEAMVQEAADADE